MKKLKKLHLNKIRIVALENANAIHGGSGNTDCTDTTTSLEPNSMDPDVICGSTGITYGGNDGGTLRSLPSPTQECSAVLTECELADM